MFDVFINQHEFGQGGDIETGAGFIQRAHDGWFSVGLNGEIGLHFGEVLFEGGRVRTNDVMVDHHNWGAVFASDGLELPGRHVNLTVRL